MSTSSLDTCSIGQIIQRILVSRKLGEADKDLREKVNRVLPQALAI
jgi:hypothetical protein